MLAYTDIGKGSPIVFIHGLGSRKEAWKYQYELAKNNRLIIPDLRGHGETEVPGPITIDTLGRDVIELLQYLDIDSAVICGHSLGGLVAKNIAIQRPDMVKGLILANTTAHIPYFVGMCAVAKLKSALAHGRLLDKITNRGFYDKRYIEEGKKAFFIRDTYVEASKAAVGLNYFPYLPFINKPVLLIGSTHDKVTPLVNVKLTSMLIPNCKTVVLDKAGHMSNIEKKHEFNAAVLNFVMREDFKL